MGNVCLIALLPITLLVGILFSFSRIHQFFCVGQVKKKQVDSFIVFILIMGVNFTVVMAMFMFKEGESRGQLSPRINRQATVLTDVLTLIHFCFKN